MLYIYIYIYTYDEIRFINHRYKVITLLVSACTINNNKTKQPPKNDKNLINLIKT